MQKNAILEWCQKRCKMAPFSKGVNLAPSEKVPFGTIISNCVPAHPNHPFHVYQHIPPLLHPQPSIFLEKPSFSGSTEGMN